MIAGISLLLLFLSLSTSFARQPGAIQMDLLEKNLREHVRVLSSEIGRRDTSRHENLRAAGHYIEEILKMYGYAVRSQTYLVEGREMRNIIASQPGQRLPEETILVGAHYDTVPETPGADDNASGVAGMLELARLSSASPTARTLKFVAFSNEEDGMMGSRVYARRAKEEGEKIVAMLSLEMIGFFSDQVGSQQYPAGLRFFYPDTGNFIGVVGHLRYMGLVWKVKTALKKHSTVPVESLAGVSWIRGIELSDHTSFWREGYPALMITDTAFYRNPHYHTSTDTSETLDYKRMAEVVLGLYHVLNSLDK